MKRRSITRRFSRHEFLASWRGLILVLGMALLLRLLWLNADPATNLTWSGAPFTDEGLYSHAARNRALFGVWRTDGWDDRLVSPLWSLLAYATFATFGVGYVQLRLINVLLSTVLLALFWRWLRPDFRATWALLATALVATDWFWFQHSRLGLLEPGMVVWLVAAAACFRAALPGSTCQVPDRAFLASVLCGACVGLAVVWKSLALLFMPAPLIALVLLDRAFARKSIALGYVGGLALVGIGYGLLWWWPNRAELAIYNQFYARDRVPGSVLDATRSIWNNARSREVWAQTPVLLIAALVGAFRAAAAAWQRRITPGVALALTWLICGAALLALPYSPARYYTLLLPSVVALAVYAVTPGGRPRLHHYGAIVLVAGAFAWNSVHYGQWAATRRSTLISTSQAITDLVQPGALVLGVQACGLSLANPLPCAPLFAGLANDDRPVERLGARYAIVEVGSRDDFLRRFYDPLLRRSQKLHEFQVGTRQVALFRLQEEPDP